MGGMEAVYPARGAASIFTGAAVAQSFQGFLQSLDGAEHPGLDGADRNAEDLGDLGVLEAAVLREQQHLPLALRERLDGLLDRRSDLAAVQVAGGVREIGRAHV